MKIAFVCTNYNNSNLTVNAANSLLANINHDIRIYVVDNASKSEDMGALDELTKRINRVSVIKNATNLGYFPGLNIGIATARKECEKDTWFIIGNNDLKFPPLFCDKLEEHVEKFQDYLVISPDIVTLDGLHQNPHVISKISAVREIFYDLYYSNYYLGLCMYKLAKLFPKSSRRGDEDQWRHSRKIYQGHGSCYLLSPKFFEYFDKLFAPTLLMSEEFFLSHQLASINEQVYYSPEISVTHHWHGSLSNIPSRRRWNLGRAAHREYRKYVKVFFR